MRSNNTIAAAACRTAGVVSKQELDQAKSALDAAKAQVQALEANVREQQVQLHYYQVIAPRAGIVGDIPVHVGDRVTTTTVSPRWIKPGTLEAYVYVPIERAPQLKMICRWTCWTASGKRARRQQSQFHLSASR